MIKGNPELIEKRREEIINACEALYGAMSFKEITMKEIGENVPFSRPTIYNYFHTKEEIFLALFRREYERWIADLERIYNDNDSLTKPEFAEKTAHSLSDRPQLLKLIAMNIYDMEENSRLEQLIEFKRVNRRLIEALGRLFEKFIPEITPQKTKQLLYMFFSFIFGIYPMTNATDKQLEAMGKAGTEFEKISVYKLIYEFLITITK